MHTCIKIGNSKLPKTMGIFDLPSGTTCGRSCIGCYAKKAERMYKAVLPFRTKNWKISKTNKFKDIVVGELSKKKNVTTCRIHSSGDFYSQEYVDKWTSIASAMPKLIFYAYTKRINEFDFTEFKALTNTVLINSAQYGELNYGKEYELQNLIKIGAKLCPCHIEKHACGTSCTYCQTKQAEKFAPVFVKH